MDRTIPSTPTDSDHTPDPDPDPDPSSCHRLLNLLHFQHLNAESNHR